MVDFDEINAEAFNDFNNEVMFDEEEALVEENENSPSSSSDSTGRSPSSDRKTRRSADIRCRFQ